MEPRKGQLSIILVLSDLLTYHPILMLDVIFVYGHEITEYSSNDAVTEKFPVINPNPVLTADAGGFLQFINPATKQLVNECNENSVESILPDEHKKIISKCLKLGASYTEKRILREQTIVWSYQPVSDRKLVYIYGHCTKF